MIDVLVIGGDSVIGGALFKHLNETGLAVVATSRRDAQGPKNIFLDLAAPVADWIELPMAKTWVIVAAIARLAACRLDPENSCKVNVTAVEELACQAKEKGARVIFLSSDKAFDGRQKNRLTDEPTCPRSEYGRQKSAAEKIVQNASIENLIIRLTKVLSPDDPLLVSWRGSLAIGEPIKPFSDKTFAPVALATVTTGIYRAIQHNVSGILQFSGPDDVTYASIAHYLASLLEVPDELVTPHASADLGMPPEERPPFTSLDTKRARDTLKLEFATPNELLDQIVSNRLTS